MPADFETAPFVAGLTVVLLILVGCKEDRIQQAGYFKSEDRNRVIAFHADDPVFESEAQEVFGGVMHTAGKYTRALIYVGKSNPAPGDELTLAASTREAMVLTANPPHDDWSWIMHISATGERSINRQ